jgi:hypothetical protein
MKVLFSGLGGGSEVTARPRNKSGREFDVSLYA